MGDGALVEFDSALDATECAAILNELTPLFESGALKPPVVAEQFPLSDAAKAYEHVASGQAGKVVLVMPAGTPEHGGLTAAAKSEKS
jgi:NADPH:quinone reductase-like Zn-dependent oxidoreductase